jgi:hypothetical protein
MLAGDEDPKELPQQVADYFFPEVAQWLRRAVRIKADSGQDIILAFETTAPVEEELVEKIVRCARALF